MPVLGGLQVTPRVGNVCCVDGCNDYRHLLHLKAVGSRTIYLTLCPRCYEYCRDKLEVTTLLLLVDEEEAWVNQIMTE